MYFQRDYVLRMIEMLGEMVRRICSIAREADAYRELEEICQKACGMPLAMLLGEDAKTLCQLLGDAQRYLAGELLLIQLEIDRRTVPEEELLPIKQQALSLFASLEEPDFALPAAGKARALLSDIQEDMPPQLLMDACRLFERVGEYGDGEDLLFFALTKDPHLRREGEAFYERLSALPDHILAKGNFSRAEIAEGLLALPSTAP